MKFRTFILASAASLLLASPALAGEGWYLGLGAGWDSLNSPKLVGAGATILEGALPEVAELDLVWLLQEGSELFARYRRR